MKKEYRFPALIVLAGIITFINSLANTFVGDDKAFNYFSPFERPMYSLSYMFGLSGQAVYRPFHFLYFNIISVLSQGNPAILHGIQVGLHIACALLLYALLRKFIHNTLALILSLMFVVHPVNSETVNYLAASSDILVFLFGILALRQRSLWKMVLFLLIGLLINEAGLSFVFIAAAGLLLFDKKNIKTSVIPFITLAIYGFLRYFVAKASFHNYGSVPILKLPYFERFLSIPKVFFYYLRMTVWPTDIANSQLWVVKSLNVPDFFFPLLVDLLFVAGAVAAGIFLYRRQKKLFRPYLFFAVWFVFGIAPYLHLYPIDSTVADRWYYIPFAGLLGMIGMLIQTVKVSRPWKTAGIAAAAVIIVLLGIRTFVRNGDWQNNYTLYSHDVLINPNFDLHAKVAGELLARNRLDEAKMHAQTALSMEPDDIPSLGTMALIDIRENQPKQAIPLLQKLVKLDPSNYLGLTNLINAYLLSGDREQARTLTLEALKRYPDDQSLMMFLQMNEEQNPPTLPR